MKQTRIYISGKITGLHINTAKSLFKQKEDSFLHGKLSHRFPNCEVVNPMNLKPFLGINNWYCYMITDLYHLSKCSHIYMLHNHTTSRGAKIELAFALLLKKKVIAV